MPPRKVMARVVLIVESLELKLFTDMGRVELKVITRKGYGPH